MKIKFILFALAGFALSVHGQDTTRTTAATWQVQKYDLEVTLPSDGSRGVAVKALLTLKNISGRPASSLTLRLTPLAEISAVKINDSVADFAKNEEKLGAVSLQRVPLRIALLAPDGVVTASLTYKINLKDNTALGSVTPAAAQFLPLSFWYPTPNSWFFPRGADTAPVRLKVNAPAGQTVLSSGTETGGAYDQKLLAQPFFAVGSWDISDQNGVAVYGPKGMTAEAGKRGAELAGLFSEARTFIAGILGRPPDAPLRIVASRRGAGFGTGGTIIVDEAVFRRTKVDSLTAMNIAEAAAKLWLGNAILVNGEGHGIIAEGLSRYLATQFIESKYGKDVADIERLRQRNAYAAVSRRDAPMSMVSPLDDFYYGEVANKGAMAWRIIAKRVGPTEFSKLLQANAQDGSLNVLELRAAFSTHKELVDYLFDQITDMNLIVGLPQPGAGETRVNLRNTGGTDVTVDVVAITSSGEKIAVPTTVKARSYGETGFRSAAKIDRVEIDPDKLYPQIDYSDDVKPQIVTESDLLLAVKRLFDKQDFVGTERTARTLLRDLPRFDDLRILLGRSLLAQNKNMEAEKEFRTVLDEKLPSARSIAWANVGLGEISSRASQNDLAAKYAEAAIMADAEYGASLAARNLRNRLNQAGASDAGVKAFFLEFDKAATANRKAEVDALVLPGEVTRFAAGVSGSTEQWQTQIRQIDRLDAHTVLVEANMTIKLLNKDAETGMAVYRLARVGNGWKLSAVEMFEVR